MNVALRPDSLNLISLCTGGAGLDLGLELAIPSARPVVCMEREAVAVARLASAMEEGLLAPAPIWSDVRTFDGRPWRGIVDGLIGGIPCQPHSVAGQQLGEEDERDLWTAARRIIIQARPWFVLIENVEGMLHTGGLERVCRNLRRLCFQVEVGLFSASECGATHQRNRLFVLAVADAWSGQLPLPGRGTGSSKAFGGRPRDQSAGSGAGMGHADDAGLEGRDRGSLRECASERTFGAAGRGLGDAYAERKPQPQWPLEVQRGRLEHDGSAMADTSGQFLREQSERQPECCDQAFVATDGTAVADADLLELRREPSARQLAFDERNARRSLFPPGPNDIDGWRYTLELWPEFEPAVRRLADGVVGRVDELRMLGNGVVPLQAAYAVRTLATRLARRSAGAGRLVRMMH